MKATRIALHLFGLTLVVGSALAIKCYNCESTMQPECAEITSSTKLQAQDCTPTMVAIESANWLRELIKIVYYTSQDASMPKMVCQKIVGRRGPNSTTIRSCQLDAAQTDQCQVARQKLSEKRYPDSEIISCSVCSEDYCNSARPMSSSSSMGLTLAILLYLFYQLY